MQVISLFSGIGGFEIAAEWMGWQNIASCEINPFGQKILKYYWPNSYHHDDVKTLDYEEIKKRIDPKRKTIVVGGFPCQPYSLAGKRLGKEDDRHLWPYCIETVKQLRPDFCVFENVFGLINWSNGLVFHEVQTDLEAAGYEVWPYVLPACAVNAPHRRDRVWFVAYARFERQAFGCQQPMGVNELRKQQHAPHPEHHGCNGTENGQGMGTGNDSAEAGANEASEFEGYTEPSAGAITDTEGLRSDRTPKHENDNRQSGERRGCNTYDNGEVQGGHIITNTTNEGLEGGKRRPSTGKGFAGHIHTNWEQFPTQPPVRPRNDGLPELVDGITFSKWRNESIKAGGNAIVPQVAHQIFKSIEQYESNMY